MRATIAEMSPAVSTVEVKARARALGFDAVGVARAEVLEREHARYRAFVEQGFSGEMEWLAHDDGDARKRVDTTHVLPGARSVVCVASAYQRPAEDEAADPPLARSIARYARGRDYHNGLRKRLRKLAAFVRGLEEGARARPLCDDAPILERAWAARAGLGFVGKNAMLIVPGRGSFVLLGEVVTTVDLVPDQPIAERCGSCTRCLDACPTSAFVAPFVLDARKCVSYLTIELRGEVPAELREGVGEHLFGCDDCQTVCPFTHGSSPDRHPTSPRYLPLERWASTSLADLVALEPASPAWRALAEGSPLHRATADGLARNAAIVLGNRGEGRAALERAAAAHPSEVVRDAARWAIARIEKA